MQKYMQSSEKLHMLVSIGYGLHDKKCHWNVEHYLDSYDIGLIIENQYFN